MRPLRRTILFETIDRRRSRWTTRWMDKNRGGALLLLLFTLRSRREEHALTRPIKSRAVSGLNIDAIPRKIHGNICSLLFALRAKHTALFGLPVFVPVWNARKTILVEKSKAGRFSDFRIIVHRWWEDRGEEESVLGRLVCKDENNREARENNHREREREGGRGYVVRTGSEDSRFGCHRVRLERRDRWRHTSHAAIGVVISSPGETDIWLILDTGLGSSNSTTPREEMSLLPTFQRCWVSDWS